MEKTEDTITNPSTAITTDQTSSSQDKEQILTFEESDSYLKDHIQGEQGIETSTTISSQVSSNSLLNLNLF